MPFWKGKDGKGRAPTGLAKRPVPRDIAAQSESVAEREVRRAGAPGKVGVGLRVQVVHPPHIYPPYNAAHFYAFDNASFVGAITQKFTGASAKVTIPQGNVGVVRELTCYVNSLALTSQIAFAVLVNGNPVEGYANMGMPQGTVTFFSFSPTNVFILVGEGNTIEMRAVVTDVVTYTLGFELRGWSWSKEIAGWWAGAV